MNDVNQLQGRVAIVSGGARGIGLSIVKTLVSQGAKVVIADNGSNINGTNFEVDFVHKIADEFGPNVIAIPRSVSDPAEAKEIVDSTTNEFGGVDILVNNAAIIRDSFIFKGKPDDFDTVVKTNLSGAWYLTNSVAPIMRQQTKEGRGGEPYNWGRIINITSTAGFYGNFGQSPYASSKSGMLGLMRTTAMDLNRAGVTCNSIAPFAATRVTETIEPANDEQSSYKERDLKISPKHVAIVVAWLCSKKSQKITGQLFGVRGREVFLFSQPRPVAKITSDTDWEIDSLDELASRNFSTLYTDLKTDLEAFSSEPKI